MNRFLLGAAFLGAILVLASFAVDRCSRGATLPTPLRLSDFTLDRALRITLPNSAGMQTQVTAQMPMAAGFIITEIAGAQCTIDVNGVGELIEVPSSGSRLLNPPIVIRPGDIVTIHYAAPTVLGGYGTLPGET